MTDVELNWDDSDAPLVAGSPRCKHSVIGTNAPNVRAVIGGTGPFAAARGQMVSEKLPGGWHRHSIRIVD